MKLNPIGPNPALLSPNLAVLACLDLFRDLSPEALRKLERGISRVTFPAGRTLLTVDRQPTSVYLILEGTVKVQVEEADGAEVVVAVMSVRGGTALEKIAQILEEKGLVLLDADGSGGVAREDGHDAFAEAG